MIYKWLYSDILWLHPKILFIAIETIKKGIRSGRVGRSRMFRPFDFAHTVVGKGNGIVFGTSMGNFAAAVPDTRSPTINRSRASLMRTSTEIILMRSRIELLLVGAFEDLRRRKNEEPP